MKTDEIHALLQEKNFKRKVKVDEIESDQETVSIRGSELRSK
jgi:hypothetical protein